jgi:hypothetical protein
VSIEQKSAIQLEQMIADLTGFEPSSICVTKVGNSGDFNAIA